MGLEAFSDFINRFKSPDTNSISTHDDNLKFFMEGNGYTLSDGNWSYSLAKADKLAKKFVGTQTSFFGPSPARYHFFINKLGGQEFITAFSHPVAQAIRKYREVDENQAGRIAYFFGGIIRLLRSDEEAIKAINFMSRMAMLGDRQSGEAIAGSVAMYIISGGSTREDKEFEGHVYHMAEAISTDPIEVQETKDLGLSQVARLRNFRDEIEGVHRPFPSVDIRQSMLSFHNFPTVGAEFHFPVTAPDEYPYFWQRLAILNMSQYHPGSYVQLSRNDRDVIEIRMNPSVYPVTIANWAHMRLLLPELNQAYFTLTLNRPDRDFTWSGEDGALLNNLRALGLISYSGVFESIPHTEKSEEINFGSVYLGQTVRLNREGYQFTGNWSRGEGHQGQMGIYAGFGDTLPSLAYYLSMALKNPDILSSARKQLSNVATLKDALALNSRRRRYIFSSIQNQVEIFPDLNRAHEAGNQIIELLNS